MYPDLIVSISEVKATILAFAALCDLPCGQPLCKRQSCRNRDLPDACIFSLDFMQGPSGTPYCLGLTGSIGMGKTTIGRMFRDLQVPVLEADATVHELYAKGGAAVPVVKNMFPDAVVDGKCTRSSLFLLSCLVTTAVHGRTQRNAACLEVMPPTTNTV
jgi:hypothetical protein